MRMTIREIGTHKVRVFLPPEHVMNKSSDRAVRRTFIRRHLNGVIQPWVWEIQEDWIVPIGSKLYRRPGQAYKPGHLRLEFADDSLLTVVRREYHRRYKEYLNTWDTPWDPDGCGFG